MVEDGDIRSHLAQTTAHVTPVPAGGGGSEKNNETNDGKGDEGATAGKKRATMSATPGRANKGKGVDAAATEEAVSPKQKRDRGGHKKKAKPSSVKPSFWQQMELREAKTPSNLSDNTLSNVNARGAREASANKGNYGGGG